MTIDVAIAHIRNKANSMKQCAEILCCTQDFFSDIEYHEQLADWLELLKWYQQGMEDIPSESGVLPRDVYRAGYNKAVDDYVERLKETYKPCKEADNYMYTNVCRRFDDIAQQLKDGGIDGNERTNR